MLLSQALIHRVASLAAPACLTAVAFAQVPTLEGQPLFDGQVHRERFGVQLALDGDWLAVAAPRSVTAPGHVVGGVHLYERRPEGWVHSLRLGSPESDTDAFGAAIAMEGSWLAVGATWHEERVGRVYLYEHGAEGWSLADVLEGSGPMGNFGAEIAFHEGRLAVGAPQYAVNGAVYLYEHGPKGWTLVHTLRPPFGPSDDWGGFGEEIIMDDLRIVVAAPRVGELHQGAVSVFVEEQGQWDLQQQIPNPLISYHANFGMGLLLDGERLFIGGPCDGFVYEYRHDGQRWELARSIEAESNDTSDHFGAALALVGEDLAIGAHNEADPVFGAGSVHLYSDVGGEWQQVLRLRAQDYVDAGDAHLGASLLVDGETLLVGAHLWQDSGRVYAFDLSGNGKTVPVPTCMPTHTMPCPCLNTPHDLGDGCRNSSGHGLRLTFEGSTSLAQDDLSFIVENSTYRGGLFLCGDQQLAEPRPLHDGLLCVGGNVQLMQFSRSEGTALVADDVLRRGAEAGFMQVGEAYYFQFLSRDQAHGGCGTGANLSNGLEVVVAP